MILELLLFVVGGGAILWFVGRPLVFKPLMQLYRGKRDHEEMVHFIETEGSAQDRGRLKVLERRRALLRLAHEEASVAREALSAPGAHALLIGAKVDTDMLDQLLASAEETDRRSGLVLSREEEDEYLAAAEEVARERARDQAE